MPVGPGHRTVQRKPQSFEFQEILGALLDRLIIEDPGAGQVTASLFDFVVAELTLMKSPDLFDHRSHGAIGILRAGS